MSNRYSPEVSSFVRERLVRGEEVYRWTRRHWFSLFLRLRWPGIVFLGLCAVFANEFQKGLTFKEILLGLAIAAAIGVWAFFLWYEWRKVHYVVTNRRVLKLGGLVNILAPRDEANLDRIENIDSFVEEGILYKIGGLFGMRTIIFQIGDSKVLYPDSPSWFGDAIWQARESAGGGTLLSDDLGSAGPPPPMRRQRRR